MAIYKLAEVGIVIVNNIKSQSIYFGFGVKAMGNFQKLFPACLLSRAGQLPCASPIELIRVQPQNQRRCWRL